MDDKVEIGKLKIEISLLTESFGCAHLLASAPNSLNFLPILSKGLSTVQSRGAKGRLGSSTGVPISTSTSDVVKAVNLNSETQNYFLKVFRMFSSFVISQTWGKLISLFDSRTEISSTNLHVSRARLIEMKTGPSSSYRCPSMHV